MSHVSSYLIRQTWRNVILYIIEVLKKKKSRKTALFSTWINSRPWRIIILLYYRHFVQSTEIMSKHKELAIDLQQCGKSCSLYYITSVKSNIVLNINAGLWRDVILWENDTGRLRYREKSIQMTCKLGFIKIYYTYTVHYYILWPEEYKRVRWECMNSPKLPFSTN